MWGECLKSRRPHKRGSALPCFEILAAPGVKQTEPPEKEELRILREEIDPYRYIIGR
jgi:hypothetical protein